MRGGTQLVVLKDAPKYSRSSKSRIKIPISKNTNEINFIFEYDSSDAEDNEKDNEKENSPFGRKSKKENMTNSELNRKSKNPLDAKTEEARRKALVEMKDAISSSNLMTEDQEIEYMSSNIKSRQITLDKEVQKYVNSAEFKEEAKYFEENCVFRNQIIYQKEINKFCKKIIKNSIVFGANTYTHNFNDAVIGPRRSGKSTFLKLLQKDVLIALKVNKELDSTLVLTIDFENMEKELQGMFGLYEFLLNLTFREIERKYQSMKAYKNKLIEYFMSLITKDRLPSLPAKFRQDPTFTKMIPGIMDLSKSIMTACQNPAGMEHWFTVVSQVPSSLAKIFCYKKVLFIIDHFDAADFIITPQVPFNEASYACFMIEFIKKMIFESTFIISSQNDEHFFETIQKLANYGVNLLDRLKFDPLTDVEIQNSAMDETVLIEYFNEENYVEVNRNHVSCPGYVVIWNYVVTLLKRNKTQQVQAAAIDVFTKFLPLIFDERSLPPTRIKRVIIA